MTEALKRGGKKRRPKSRPAHQQVVNVKVKVGDAVLLHKGKAPEQHAPSSSAFGQFRLLEGVGAKYASPPAVQQSQSYGIAPASKAPMYNEPIKVGGGAVYNAHKADDLVTPVNPNGLTPIGKPSVRAVAGRDFKKDFRVDYPITSEYPMTPDDPPAHLQPDSTPSVRAVPSQPAMGWASQNLPKSDAIELQQAISGSLLPQQEPEEQLGAMSVAEASMEPRKLIQSKLPYAPPGREPAPILRKKGGKHPSGGIVVRPKESYRRDMVKWLKQNYSPAEMVDHYRNDDYEAVAEELLSEEDYRKAGRKEHGGRVRSGVF